VLKELPDGIGLIVVGDVDTDRHLRSALNGLF
jgi:hypothetical protein